MSGVRLALSRCSHLSDRSCSGEGHLITGAHRSWRFDHGIHARTGEPTGTRSSDPVVAGERAQDVAVLGQLLLSQRRHHAAWIGEGHAEPYGVADGELAADPIVLHEPGFFGVNDDVHAEPALIEPALGLEFTQLLERGRRQDGHREQVEERPDGRRKPGLSEEAAPSFCSTTVSRWPAGSTSSISGWYWSMVKVLRRSPGQGDISLKERGQHARDIAGVAAHGRAVRQRDLHRGKVVVRSRRLDERSSAGQEVRKPLHALGTHHLAGVGVNEGIGAVTDQTRSVTCASSSRSPRIDLTGNRQRPVTEPTWAVIAMRCSLPRGARRPQRQPRKSKVQSGAHLGQNSGHRNGLLGPALVGERRMHNCAKSRSLR